MCTALILVLLDSLGHPVHLKSGTPKGRKKSKTCLWL